MRIDAKGVKSYTLLEISEMSLEISGSPTLYLWICNPRGSKTRNYLPCGFGNPQGQKNLTRKYDHSCL